MKPNYAKIVNVADRSFYQYMREDTELPFNWHFHPEYELTLILHDDGRRFIGDHIDKFHDGDMIFIGPNLPHTWCSESSGDRDYEKRKFLVTQFREEFLGKGFFTKPEMLRIRLFLEESVLGMRVTGHTRDIVHEKLLKMYDEIGMGKLLFLLEILHILSISPDLATLASVGFRSFPKPGVSKRIDVVCNHINRHYTEDLKQPEIATLVHMDTSTFSRFFRKTTGRTFTRYVNELRVGRACSLLLESDMTVAEICFDSGFNNLSQFNRKFLEFKKLTPSQYRNTMASPGA
jgi:AraC-like DNA-binding protein